MNGNQKIEFAQAGDFHSADRETVIETIAAACHMQNLLYCQLLNDDSQVPWTEAPSELKDSVISGVKGALDGDTPEQSHESWLEFKRTLGWSYGPEKDFELKTHPCMLPYGDLPEAQKRKDSFFISMVQQLGLTAGLIRIVNGGEEN